ncbi:hypothetical protein [uncultured Endozoicomonas sp.]|uniref:hypothetical protein n=1 Tax=uncultured Endozoicomonas sp. TaxID=432652 RepID=UPI002606E079|nr:hypothetical protein [uncultured Endozoicomonas sp.]
MKVQQKNSRTQRPATRGQNPFSIHQSTITSVRPLLKASTTLPATRSFDETGGYIKGYN